MSDSEWKTLQEMYQLIVMSGRDHTVTKLAKCMLELLPALQFAIEENFNGIRVSSSMLAVELQVKGTIYAVTIQCIAECNFRVRIINNKYEIIKEHNLVMNKTIDYIVHLLKSIQYR